MVVSCNTRGTTKGSDSFKISAQLAKLSFAWGRDENSISLWEVDLRAGREMADSDNVTSPTMRLQDTNDYPLPIVFLTVVLRNTASFTATNQNSLSSFYPGSNLSFRYYEMGDAEDDDNFGHYGRQTRSHRVYRRNQVRR